MHAPFPNNNCKRIHLSIKRIIAVNSGNYSLKRAYKVFLVVNHLKDIIDGCHLLLIEQLFV